MKGVPLDVPPASNTPVTAAVESNIVTCSFVTATEVKRIRPDRRSSTLTSFDRPPFGCHLDEIAGENPRARAGVAVQKCLLALEHERQHGLSSTSVRTGNGVRGVGGAFRLHRRRLGFDQLPPAVTMLPHVYVAKPELVNRPVSQAVASHREAGRDGHAPVEADPLFKQLERRRADRAGAKAVKPFGAGHGPSRC